MQSLWRAAVNTSSQFDDITLKNCKQADGSDLSILRKLLSASQLLEDVPPLAFMFPEPHSNSTSSYSKDTLLKTVAYGLIALIWQPENKQHETKTEPNPQLRAVSGGRLCVGDTVHLRELLMKIECCCATVILRLWKGHWVTRGAIGDSPDHTGPLKSRYLTFSVKFKWKHVCALKYRKDQENKRRIILFLLCEFHLVFFIIIHFVTLYILFKIQDYIICS